MSGVGPTLPSSGWKILYGDALAAFLSTPQNLRLAGPISDWIVWCREHGPPSEGIDLEDDRHLSQIPGTRVAAEYLVIEYEFLIIIRLFR